MHSRQSILYRGPKIYNDEPMEIKLLNNDEFLLLQYVFFF